MICQQKVQSMVEELCSQLKSHRGECVFKRLFNGVSLSLHTWVLRVYLCHSHANLMRCATEPAPAHRAYFCLSWNLIKEEVGANKNTQILLDYGCVASKQYRFLKQKPTTAIQHIGLHLWYTIKLRMAYGNKYMANMVSVGFIFICISRD